VERKAVFTADEADLLRDVPIPVKSVPDCPADEAVSV